MEFAQQKKEKVRVVLKRKKVDEAVKDIMAYCEKETENDPLVHETPNKTNPFREHDRKACVLL